ncbi:hypothetical protein [Pedobacter caeni]|uniref:Uncharacterized protein n=1 Tax=Pedobacter caeni TaxID=288992 RepID=A0A1M5DSI3_9SPHI|nr:hypothetical protein [Pedobacter caeni]SHF69929.1 hypothetical protein SAMN04488522_103368 [Pedobacter caeni]
MLSKSYSILQIFARQKEDKKERALTKSEWIKVDRVVIIILLAAVVIGAILFS